MSRRRRPAQFIKANHILKELNLLMILFKIVGVIFLLFVICFIAIVIEESFLGGRRRRKLEREARAKQDGLDVHS